MYAEITLNNTLHKFEIYSIADDVIFTSGEALDSDAEEVFVNEDVAAQFLEAYNLERGVTLWTYEDAFEFFASVVNPGSTANPFEFWGGWGSGTFDLTALISAERITIIDEDEEDDEYEEDN